MDILLTCLKFKKKYVVQCFLMVVFSETNLDLIQFFKDYFSDVLFKFFIT